MLGAFDFAQYANASTRFGIGDQVLLYTDGSPKAAMIRMRNLGSRD